jgi:hypothetical protein
LKVTRATRVRRFWRRHRTAFWWLHSVWALATGIAVLMLARERYGFVPWVVGFLGITWLSTLHFGRQTTEVDPDALPGVGAEVGSWLTRGMFQETLFFLLPFYAYSTVVGSWNLLFPVALGALALLSCADVVFDRWLRTKPVFGMFFFAVVAFSALNLLLPMTMGLDPARATPVAGALAVAMAIPIALQGSGRSGRRSAVGVLAGAAALLALTLFLPGIVPPVPLRLDSATFSDDIDRESLALGDTLTSPASTTAVGGRLVLLAEVFAPSSLPTSVQLVWSRDGAVVRRSREIRITAHGEGFRVWDAWVDPDGEVDAGAWEVRLTSSDRVFGLVAIEIE